MQDWPSRSHLRLLWNLGIPSRGPQSCTKGLHGVTQHKEKRRKTAQPENELNITE